MVIISKLYVNLNTLVLLYFNKSERQSKWIES
nr:MAG TPA: hypothetical protein [Caudoviricetes sp.]